MRESKFRYGVEARFEFIEFRAFWHGRLNRADLIDPAILRPGRIDRKIKVSRPDKDGAREIFGIYLGQDLPLAGKLVHPHIVQIYDAVADPKYPHLVMEYVQGIDLYDLLQTSSRLSVETTNSGTPSTR